MMHLYETHLPVSDTEIAKDFYTQIVGLPFAHRDPDRDIVFLWAVSKQQGMIGLWGPNTTYGWEDGVAQKRHVAFGVSFDQLLAAIKKLDKHGIETFGFGGAKTREPTDWVDAIRTDLFSRSRRARARIHQHFTRSAGPWVYRDLLRLEEIEGIRRPDGVINGDNKVGEIFLGVRADDEKIPQNDEHPSR